MGNLSTEGIYDFPKINKNHKKQFAVIFNVKSIKWYKDSCGQKRASYKFSDNDDITESDDISYIKNLFKTYEDLYKDELNDKKAYLYLLNYKDCTIKNKGLDFSYNTFGPSHKYYNLFLKDYWFRKPDEVPSNYRFDLGEYDGWLQYRWGDGKNKIK